MPLSCTGAEQVCEAGQIGFTPALTGLGVQAFLEASMKSDAELLQWFNDRLVWNSPTVVNELLRNGLFVREFAPQVSPGCGSCRCPSSWRSCTNGPSAVAST